jgi:DNA polymerase-3 subunit beta
VTQTHGALDDIEVPVTASMRFTMKEFILRSLFEKASAVLPSGDVQPLLKSFQVRALDDEKHAPHVQVIATNTELSVVATSPADVEQPGVAVFPSKRMLDIVKEADEASDVVVEVAEGSAHITAGRTNWELRLKPGDDYPEFPELVKLKFHGIDRAMFLEALLAVRKAAGREETKEYLMLVDVTGDGRMRAADNARLQQIQMTDWPEGLRLQVPIKAADILVKLLRSSTEEQFMVADHEDYLAFRIGADVYIATKLVTQFPDMDREMLTPAGRNKMRFAVDRADLVAAIRRVRITADPETSAVLLSLRRNRVKVWSMDKLGNVASEELAASWDSPATDVAFHHHHLIELLDMTSSDTVVFFLGEGTKTKPAPLLLSDENEGLTGVLLPLRKDFT